MSFDRRAFLKAVGAAPALSLPAAALGDRRAAGLVFAHGVASGDPLSDRVILWTRVSPPRGTGSTPVSWTVAEDPSFSRVVSSGETAAVLERDFCVKVDAAGLSPGRVYHYRFEALGERSPAGRTRTLPEGRVDELALAVVSCSNYPAGYFNAYRDIARDRSVFAVVHLGDYLYEYGSEGYASQAAAALGRISVPAHELVSLDDYRIRHAQYKADPDSRAMHAAHPLIAVWDDHEIANDAWLGGAENHQSDEDGEWSARRAAAVRAYDEWMPTRSAGLVEGEPLFRSFGFGDLASLILLDTRHFARDRQVDAMSLLGEPEQLAAARLDPSREMLGPEQSRWLSRQLSRSADRHRWQLIGQQTMVGELLIPDLSGVLDEQIARQRLGDERVDAILKLGGEGLPLLWDAWDGYAAARDRFLADLAARATSPIVLTGDLHTSVAGDLRLPDRDAPVAVELVTTSVSSPGFDPYLPTGESGQLAEAFLGANPHLRWFETSHRGWLRVTVTPDRAAAEWRHVDRVDTREFAVQTAKRLTTSHRSQPDFGLRPV
jgi:alkaline phosphatase D